MEPTLQSDWGELRAALETYRRIPCDLTMALELLAPLRELAAEIDQRQESHAARDYLLGRIVQRRDILEAFLRHSAAIWLEALTMGIARQEEIITWADDSITVTPDPPIELLELSLTGSDRHATVHWLRKLARPHQPERFALDLMRWLQRRLQQARLPLSHRLAFVLYQWLDDLPDLKHGPLGDALLELDYQLELEPDVPAEELRQRLLALLAQHAPGKFRADALWHMPYPKAPPPRPAKNDEIE